jgi:hypothetical protein
MAMHKPFHSPHGPRFAARLPESQRQGCDGFDTRTHFSGRPAVSPSGPEMESPGCAGANTRVCCPRLPALGVAG